MIAPTSLTPVFANANPAVLVVLAVMTLVLLVVAFLFVRLFSLWMRALLSGAAIPVTQLVAMKLRKVDAGEIVRLRILGVQNGVDIPTHQLERAYLAGADVERAVLAMARAKETGQNVAWDDVLRADRDERLDEPN